MSSTDVRSETSAVNPDAPPMNMQLQVVVVPVSDVDRAKRFYKSLGWHLDADYIGDDHFRIVQLTPPGSACSIALGEGVVEGTPGSVKGLQLVVSDINIAHNELSQRGVAARRVPDRLGGGDAA